MQRNLIFFLSLSVFFSMITHTLDISSDNVFVSRATISDLFGGISIVLFFLVKRKEIKKLQLPRLYKLSLLLFAGIALGIFTSLAPKRTFGELIILVYLMVYSYVLYEVFRENWRQLFELIMWSCLCFSLIGIYDLIAVNMNWYTVFSSPSKTSGGSSFRYFGQAANYTFTMLSLLIPFFLSDLSNYMLPWKKAVLSFSILVSFFLLLTTGRISILISGSIVMVLYVFLLVKKQRDLLPKVIFAFVSIHLLFFFVFPEVFENLILRFQVRISNRVEGNLGSDFFVDNIRNAYQAFLDNPIFGSGVGGFQDVYSNYEVHGTYFKLFGETGLLGVSLYVTFLWYFVKMCLQNKANFYPYFIPFLLGNLISWGYNYHLRKKEFWIFIALLMIVNSLRREKLENE